MYPFNTKIVALLLLFTLSTALPPAAHAGWATCWVDPEISEMKDDVVRRYYPEMSTPPTIEVCDDAYHLFATPGPNGVRPAGVYSFGNNTIYIPVSQLTSHRLVETIGHELAHAVNDQNNEGGGHGRAFYRVMISHGFGESARKTAQLYGNEWELAAAQQDVINGYASRNTRRAPSSSGMAAPRSLPRRAVAVQGCPAR